MKSTATSHVLLFRKNSRGEILVLMGLNQEKSVYLPDGTRIERHMGWGLLGGRVEEGETPLDAALREAEEEGGIDPSFLGPRLTPFPKDGRPYRQTSDHEQYLAVAEVPDEPWLDEIEPNDPEGGVTAIRWVPLDVLLEEAREVLVEGFPVYNSHRRTVRWYFRGTPLEAPLTVQKAAQPRAEASPTARSRSDAVIDAFFRKKRAPRP